jgi:hypothetical protein
MDAIGCVIRFLGAPIALGSDPTAAREITVEVEGA